MRNNRLLPYETIVQAASGEPEAVGTRRVFGSLLLPENEHRIDKYFATFYNIE